VVIQYTARLPNARHERAHGSSRFWERFRVPELNSLAFACQKMNDGGDFGHQEYWVCSASWMCLDSNGLALISGRLMSTVFTLKYALSL
jgi:hypothetical protein